MTVMLFDLASDEVVFDVNFWHWRAIVECIRRLDVIPVDRVAALHDPFVGGLTAAEAQAVAVAIRDRLLPDLSDDERVLIDGARTTEPDDGTFYREPAEQHRNYGTNLAVLEQFAECCDECGGFRVA